MQIQPISGVAQSSLAAQHALTSAADKSTEFADILMSVVRNANSDQQVADQALVDFSNGKTDDVHAVVMSTVQADLSFRFFLEMRNKLTESYQELSRMQF